MSNLEHKTTQELIAQIESKNRRYKLAGVVFATVLAIGLVLILVIGLRTLQGVDNQLASQKKLLDSQQQILSKIQGLSSQQANQINDLQNHIDCIVELFQQPNRLNLTINSLQDCQLTPTGATTTPSQPTNGGNNSAPSINNPGSSPAPATPAQPQNQTSTPTQPQQRPLPCRLTFGLLGCS